VIPTDSSRARSALLDVLVEEIAKALGVSSVFVTHSPSQAGEPPQAVAAFPPPADDLGIDAHDALISAADEERLVARPILSADDAVLGWAVAVGSRAPNEWGQLDEIIELLADCARLALRNTPAAPAAPPAAQLWEDAARDGFWEWDLDAGTVRFSRRCLALFGHRGDDEPDRPEFWFDRLHPEDRVALLTALLGVLADRRVRLACEHRILHADGSFRWILARAMVQRDESGRPVRLVGWLADVSRRKHLEAELRQARKLGDVGRLAAGAAHDFNNLLAVIRSHSELALAALDADTTMHEDVEVIRQAADRAASLTRQLLALSRGDVVTPRLVDLNDLIIEVEHTLRSLAGESTRLIANLAPRLGRIRADAHQVERVLMNLVANARDAMAEGGALTIETANRRLDGAAIATEGLELRPGDYVTLSVADTGSGIDDSVRARIFEPFFTTKEPGRGTGLGLATVREIVEATGGAIGIATRIGVGTTFTLYFPRMV
jgi:two-component system, cell cycle sensor histidine kinase and response regulator CckA